MIKLEERSILNLGKNSSPTCQETEESCCPRGGEGGGAVCGRAAGGEKSNMREVSWQHRESTRS